VTRKVYKKSQNPWEQSDSIGKVSLDGESQTREGKSYNPLEKSDSMGRVRIDGERVSIEQKIQSPEGKV
jgi:hypothetical protein